MSDNVVALADYGVNIDGETLYLTRIPDPKSKLVEAQKRSILVDLNLDDLSGGLRRSAGLLFLAFNGVAGKAELRRDINALQDKLASLCGDTQLALNRFSRWSSEVLGTMKDVFTYLVDSDEAIAIEVLKDSSAVAAKMADEANTLATRFDALADETMTVSGRTQVAQGQSAEQKAELEAQQNDLMAKNANAKSLSNSLAQSRKKLEALYAEAKAKADQAADRGFAVQMVGAILGPIAQGLGSIGGAFVAARTGGALGGPSTPPTLPKADRSEEVAAKKKLEEENAKKVIAEQEVKMASAAKVKAETDETKAIEAATAKETAATLAKEKTDEKPDDAALKTAAETAKTEAAKAKIAKKAAELALSKAKAELKRKEEALATIGESIKSAQIALETTSKNLQAVGDGLLDLAKSYEEEKRNYLRLMLDYEKQEFEALANMAEYAVRMSAVKDLIGVERTASESLLQAIKALNTVAQILRDAAKFWTQMKDACDDLANPTFQRRVELFSKQPAEKRAAEWKKDAFKTMGVTYMAKWQALHLVCLEYSQSTTETRKEIQANIVMSPSPEESLKLVPDLAKNLSVTATRAKDVALDKVKTLQLAGQDAAKAA